MKSKYGLELNRDYYSSNGGVMNLTETELATLKSKYPSAQFKLYNPLIADVSKQSPGEKVGNLQYYPKSFNHSNTESNFSTFWVPKKGETIELNPYTVTWYKRIITAYELRSEERRVGKECRSQWLKDHEKKNKAKNK